MRNKSLITYFLTSTKYFQHPARCLHSQEQERACQEPTDLTRSHRSSRLLACSPLRPEWHPTQMRGSMAGDTLCHERPCFEGFSTDLMLQPKMRSVLAPESNICGNNAYHFQDISITECVRRILRTVFQNVGSTPDPFCSNEDPLLKS